MSRKMALEGKVGTEQVKFVDMTPEEMQLEIVRLNNVLFDAQRSLRRLSNSAHPALEAARFTLTHGGSNRKREDRGGWNTPKNKKKKR